MTHTYYLEITKPEDLKQIEQDLKQMLETADLHRDPDNRQMVTMTLKVDLQLIAGLMEYAGVSRRPALVDWGHRMGHLGGEAA
jgi:hypothetical protein